MTFTTSKGQYVSKGVKSFEIKVLDSNNKCIDTVVVHGNKKTASNKVDSLQKKYKKELN